MKFIEINDDQTVNIDTISYVERLSNGSLLYIGDRRLIAEIPYDTIIGILQTQDDIDKEQKPASIPENYNNILDTQQFTRI